MMKEMIMMNHDGDEDGDYDDAYGKERNPNHCGNITRS